MSVKLHSPLNAGAFLDARGRVEALLIGYLVAGDPNAGESFEMIQESAEAGIDIIELGVPSRDPFVDGEVIKRAHARAEEAGMGEKEALFALWRTVRREVLRPIWAMGYKSELVDNGLYRELIAEQLIDALVLPDCTLEEQIGLQREVAASGVDVIRFINSAMHEQDIVAVCDGATIIYAQSYAGTTGDPMARIEDLSVLCERIRPHLPEGMLVAGFGLRSPQRVGSAVRGGFDGAVVGSALVSRSENREKDYLYRLVAEMKLQTRVASEEGGSR
ncbi:tryptophan synthase subunit alpha [Cohnella soli]|uniref:tryptophan synthase n=1 Tax=Cohnella soli TaxID=425005 RepID=A0ABW0HUH5_9BACL